MMMAFDYDAAVEWLDWEFTMVVVELLDFFVYFCLDMRSCCII